MRRYKNLPKKSIQVILNGLINLFSTAENNDEASDLVMGLLTRDERIKLGRRILIAEMLIDGKKHNEIIEELNVGEPTIQLVTRKMNRYPRCFELLNSIQNKNENKKDKKLQSVGGSKMIYKKRVAK